MEISDKGNQQDSTILLNQEEAHKIEKEINIENEIKFSSLPQFDENAIFIDYNPESVLQKLITIDQSPYQERLTYTKHLSDLIQVVGAQILPHLQMILEKIILESDDIKRAILEQIPQIISFLQQQEKSNVQLITIMIPILFQLLENNDLFIKENSGICLAQIGQLLNEEQRGKYILTKFLTMSHDDENEDNRIVSIQLLARMADCFGKSLTEQFVGLEILSLGEDQQLRVRKESVINLPIIAKVVSEDFFNNRLLPFYLNKCSENIWGVRKSCVDIIIEISKLCNKDQQKDLITDVMLKFLKDPNKWVKISAFKNLGQFISVQSKHEINQNLFKHYISMTEVQVYNLGTDYEILESCAYNFPCILQIYGKQKWNELKITFSELLKINSQNIKKPLACSLHIIAQILGQKLAEEDLIQVLQQLLIDQHDDVKYGAIKIVADFLTVFEPQKREKMIDVFLVLQKDPKKWRIRQHISQQISKLASIFNTEAVFQYILPISMKLCNDSVSIVRKQAAKQVFSVLDSLKNYQDGLYQEMLIDNIKAFSQAKRYNQRQTFVLICKSIINNSPELFKNNFLEQFELMSRDKIINVRILVAKIVGKQFRQNGTFKENKLFQQMYHNLNQEQQRDIKYALHKNYEQISLIKQNSQQVTNPLEIINNENTNKNENNNQIQDHPQIIQNQDDQKNQQNKNHLMEIENFQEIEQIENKQDIQEQQ